MDVNVLRVINVSAETVIGTLDFVLVIK